MINSLRQLKKREITIFLIVLIAIIFISVFYLLGLENKKNAVNSNMAVNNDNWLIYKNNVYNFSYHYPKDWTLEEVTPENIQLYIEHQTTEGPTKQYQFSLFIEDNKEQLSAEQWVKNKWEGNKGFIINQGYIKVGNYNGFNLIYSGVDGVEQNIFLSYKNKIYWFIFPTGDPKNVSFYDPVNNYNIAQKIISTFTFLD